jgi:hypothetical protein
MSIGRITASCSRSRRTKREGRSGIQTVIVQCCVTIHCVIEGAVRLGLRTTPYSRKGCGSKVILTLKVLGCKGNSNGQFLCSNDLLIIYCVWEKADQAYSLQSLLQPASCEGSGPLSTDDADLLTITLHGPCDDSCLPGLRGLRGLACLACLTPA